MQVNEDCNLFLLPYPLRKAVPSRSIRAVRLPGFQIGSKAEGLLLRPTKTEATSPLLYIKTSERNRANMNTSLYAPEAAK